MADSSYGDILKRRAGPLPYWGWGILGVGVLAFYLYRKNKAAAAVAAAQQGSGVTGTNLGSNTLSQLTPTAYPMPFQQGDVFVNTTVPASTPTPPATTPPPGNTSTPQTHFYVVKQGDTWDSIGKALNIAPVALWENNGAPAGFKLPGPGTQINLNGIYQNPSYAYNQQATIIANEGKLKDSGFKPTPGKVY